jgi:hypothetical protein
MMVQEGNSSGGEISQNVPRQKEKKSERSTDNYQWGRVDPH